MEVYYNGRWGTVCDDGWSITDAKYAIYKDHQCQQLTILTYSVVCRQLGYGNAVRAYSNAFFGAGSSLQPTWLDNVGCTSSDQYLSECNHNGWGIENCDHFDDAGVACSGTG